MNGCAETSREDIKAGLRVTWIGTACNLLLIALKLWGGLAGRSQALIADAVHSVSDLFSDAVVLAGLKWGRKQADENHPYGHGRIETVASMAVGLLLVAAGLYIAVRAVGTILADTGQTPRSIAIVVAGISVLVKEALYWYTIRVGRRIRSSALIGNAWHHRTDAFSSVAVLIGVVAAEINPDWYFADSIAAAFVSIMIFRVAYSLLRAAFHELVDTAPDERTLVLFKEQAEGTPGVMQVHGLKARHSGPITLIEMHVVVDSAITVHDGHEIAEAVKARLIRADDTIGDVLVHIEPESEMI